jgi:hypothetical protein
MRLALLAATVLTLAAAPAGAAAATTARPKATLAKVTVKKARITVTGTVALPHDTAHIRGLTRVSFTLSGRKGRAERFAAGITATRRFTATHETKLTGALTLKAVVRIAGRAAGPTARTSLSVAPPATPVASGGGSGVGDGPLDGTFKIASGRDTPTAGSVAGSWFQMITSSGVPLRNPQSPMYDKNYTPLSAGTDGGLETFEYQPAPSPAFSGGTTGNALADRIMHPQSFFGTDFSIVTDATDDQTGASDPLPSIALSGGRLSGQLTAWAASWNGQWFNQGSPKPDGTFPGATLAVFGTYDPSTDQYALTWKSLIVGGPFNGFTGVWHLEGTFAPRG